AARPAGPHAGRNGKVPGVGGAAAGAGGARVARRRGGAGRPMSSIPLADAPALREPPRRTVVIRQTLALVCIASLISIVLLARHPHTRTIVPLPAGAQTVLVLDLSASI